jgi:hypothetical protein
MRGSTQIPRLTVSQPFDTPAARAAQGERDFTLRVGEEKFVRPELVEGWADFSVATWGF